MALLRLIPRQLALRPPVEVGDSSIVHKIVVGNRFRFRRVVVVVGVRS